MVELVGLKLGTHHPVIEPVSTGAGNGNFLRGDRPAKAGPSASRDGLRDAPEARKPRFPRTIARLLAKVQTQRLGGGRTRARTWDPMIKSQRIEGRPSGA